MKTSSKLFQYFLCLCGLILIANLLVMNDAMTVWSGAEAYTVWELRAIFHNPIENIFWFRFLGGIIFSISLVVSFYLGKKVFGERSMLLMLLVLSSSLLIPNLAKVITLDIWLFAFQWMGFLSLILFCKQPKWIWRIFFYLNLGLSMWFSPWSSIALFSTLALFLYFLHPQGKRMWQLNPWGAGLGFLGLLYLLDGIGRFESAIAIGQYQSQYSYFLLLLFLGLFPFFGFLLGGLRDVFQKVRRGEEYSLIIASALAASIIGQSLIFQALMALIIAKQLQVYFDKNYPYRVTVQTGAILQLLFAFGLATFVMMKGFVDFRGVGFRAGLGFSLIYWVCSFVGVIGLYAMNRRYLIGGPVIGGLLATLLFWLLINPLLESKRNVPNRLVEELRTLSKDNNTLYWQGNLEKSNNVALYLISKFDKSFVNMDEANWDRALQQKPNGVFITNVAVDSTVIDTLKTFEIEGWNDHFQPIKYTLINK